MILQIWRPAAEGATVVEGRGRGGGAAEVAAREVVAGVDRQATGEVAGGTAEAAGVATEAAAGGITGTRTRWTRFWSST
jgi:hypothetical protein